MQKYPVRHNCSFSITDTLTIVAHATQDTCHHDKPLWHHVCSCLHEKRDVMFSPYPHAEASAFCIHFLAPLSLSLSTFSLYCTHTCPPLFSEHRFSAWEDRVCSQLWRQEAPSTALFPHIHFCRTNEHFSVNVLPHKSISFTATLNSHIHWFGVSFPHLWRRPMENNTHTGKQQTPKASSFFSLLPVSQLKATAQCFPLTSCRELWLEDPAGHSSLSHFNYLQCCLLALWLLPQASWSDFGNCYSSLCSFITQVE